MLKLYLGTVVIWAIILNATARITAEQIRDNGWLEDVKPRKRGQGFVFLKLAAIPVIRFVCFIMAFYMAGKKKE